MMLCLCGCDFLTFSVEGLLSSPIIADEQTAIYQALIARTGKEVFFEYNEGNHFGPLIERIEKAITNILSSYA